MKKWETILALGVLPFSEFAHQQLPMLGLSSREFMQSLRLRAMQSSVIAFNLFNLRPA
jgi:hypothetical protein